MGTTVEFPLANQESSTCKRNIKMKSFAIIFAAFAVGAQCRTVSLSNARDTDEEIPVNTPEQLKELVALYEENFEKLVNFAIKMGKNEDDNKQKIQFLNQLSSLIEQLVQGQSRVRNVHTKLDNDTDSLLQASMRNVNNNVDNVKELINMMKKIDIVSQDGEITDEHIRIKRAAEGYEAASFATEERMTNELIDIQRQVAQIRKYLDKLCKKHPTSTAIFEVNSDDDISSIEQLNKVAIM